MKRKYIFTIFLFVLLFSCSTLNYNIRTSLKNQINEHILEIILKQANDLVGKKAYDIIVVNNKKFRLDCIGTVSAIFYSAGIDITKYFYKYDGGGVKRFYYTLKDNCALYKKTKPEIGDVIFWDNTWDSNNDGKLGNDYMTHVGMIMSIDDDGTINFIHANYVKGIIIEQMNLENPTEYKDKNGKIINSPMYINSSLKVHPDHWLSGDLFNHYGAVLKIKEIF
jgi:hypothetical protein